MRMSTHDPRRETGAIAQLHAQLLVQLQQCRNGSDEAAIAADCIGALSRSRVIRAAEWDVEFGALDVSPEGWVS